MMHCPNCGCDAANAESNLIDEAPFRQAARSAKMLRALGHTGAVIDVLSRLAAVRIQNFLRPRWRCQECGVSYDD